MENKDFIEFLQSAKGKCDKCHSHNLLLFVETRIPNCVAWACHSCQHFEIRAKPEELEEFFKKKNDAKGLSQ